MPISEDAIRSELLDVCAKVESLSDEEMLTGPSHLLEVPFRRLDVLASQEVDEETVDKILLDRDFQQVREAVARLRNVYSLRLEIEETRSILESQDPWKTLKGFTFYPNYQILAETEQAGAYLSPGDTVAFLGSGPLPLSLIVLCSERGLKGIGIERVSEWAEISRKVLDRLGLQSEIVILEGDQFTFPLERECQLVMIAAMARPKEEIFRHLAEVLLPGTRVSYRIYENGLRRLLDLDHSFTPPPEFRETLRVRPKPPVNNTVIFLTRTNR